MTFAVDTWFTATAFWRLPCWTVGSPRVFYVVACLAAHLHGAPAAYLPAATVHLRPRRYARPAALPVRSMTPPYQPVLHALLNR